MDMALGSLDSTTVVLVPRQIVMSQEMDMVLFRIVEWDFIKATFVKGKKGVRVKILMKRKITSEMMTTYFPTVLLTAIPFATTFFKPFFFEAALSVNLTTMLVMTTIFISKMEGLPPTSDIKMIDIWLVLCQMVPFAEVVLLTAMEYHRKDKAEEKKRKKKKSQKNKLSNCALINIVSEIDNQDQEKRGGTPLQMSMECNDENKPEQICCRRCWIPDLKTVGKCI